MTHSNPSIVCVGNSKILGDCFAPLVGQLLINHYHLPIHIYGNKDHNILSHNLPAYKHLTETYHNGTLVLDSAMTSHPYHNTLTFHQSACIVDHFNTKTRLGNAHILANINLYPLSNLSSLQKVKKENVSYLVHQTAHAIFLAYKCAQVYKQPNYDSSLSKIQPTKCIGFLQNKKGVSL